MNASHILVCLVSSANVGDKENENVLVARQAISTSFINIDRFFDSSSRKYPIGMLLENCALSSPVLSIEIAFDHTGYATHSAA